MRQRSSRPSKKAALSSLGLILALSCTLLTSCNAQPRQQEQPVQQEQSQSNDSSSDQAQQSVDTSKMTPWVNSNIQGVIQQDTQISPKDDLSAAVNKDWLVSTTIPDGKSSTSLFDEVNQELLGRLSKVVEHANTLTHEGKLVKSLYDLYSDSESRDAEGIEPLRRYIDEISQVKSLDQLSAYLLSGRANDYGQVVNFGIETMMSDSTRYDLCINPSSLLLGDAAEYKEITSVGKRTKEIREKVISYALERLGMSEDKAKKILADAFEFETKLAVNIPSEADYNNSMLVEAFDNVQTFDELRGAKKNLPLVNMLYALNVPNDTPINIVAPEWLDTLDELYTEENVEHFKNYMIVHAVWDLLPYTDTDAEKTIESINNEVVGITGTRSDEEKALRAVEDILPDELSKIYVGNYTNEAMRKEITDFIKEVMATYEEMLNQATWLTPQTRAKAIEKLNSIRINAVAPHEWPNHSSFNIKKPDEGGTYFNAVQTLRWQKRVLMMSKLAHPVNKDLWNDESLVTANAYYSPTKNSINILPGILLGDMYNQQMSKEEKYARIGIVIAHEISHAFDGTGAQFDKDGILNNWWTEEDKQAFQARQQKVIDYFNTIVGVPDGTPVNGQLVSNETIADMTGMQAVLKLAAKTPDFNYQEFFTQYAQTWRNKTVQSYAEWLNNRDTHPLAYLRANVVSAQFDEFQQAFDVHEGDGMYCAPDQRILVW